MQISPSSWTIVESQGLCYSILQCPDMDIIPYREHIALFPSRGKRAMISHCENKDGVLHSSRYIRVSPSSEASEALTLAILYEAGSFGSK